MTHGHDILHMMEGNSYHSKSELVDAIIGRWGSEETFHTCSAEGMTAAEIVDFLDERGKFMDTPDGGFTVNLLRVCNH